MMRQARRSGLVMGLGAHMIAGSCACSTSTPDQRRYPAIKTNQHYAEALGPPDAGPSCWAWRLRMGNHEGSAMATLERDRSHAVTRQLFGVAPPSKPRLGALLSSDDFGSSVERAAKRHPLWQLPCGLVSKVPHSAQGSRVSGS
jgi:hypothetical protein